MNAIRNTRSRFNTTTTRLQATKSALHLAKRTIYYAMLYKKVFPRASNKTCLAMGRTLAVASKRHFEIRTSN